MTSAPNRDRTVRHGAFDDTSIFPTFSLPDQAKGSVTGAVVTVQQPAIIGRERQQYPGWTSHVSEDFSFAFSEVVYATLHPASLEGRIAIVTDVERGMRWACRGCSGFISPTNSNDTHGQVARS